MKLTGRQKQFLDKFLDLYREANQPLHYAAVAARLGVGNVTAYDMLRLLEEKGLLLSEYVLPPGRSAGRSSVVFRPTPRADELVAQLAGADWERAEWQEVKERILSALHAGRGTQAEPLIEEVLARLDEEGSPLFAAAEMVTAMVLHLSLLGQEAQAGSVGGILRSLGFPGEMGLNALAGLTVGLSLVGRTNRRLTTQLIGQVQRYQQNLALLSSDNMRRLSDFAGEAGRIVGL